MPEHQTRYYLDEDVPVQVTPAMRALGLDVPTTLEAGRIRSPDRSQLEFAAREGRALVTRNRNDFIALTNEFLKRAAPHAGILVIPRSFVMDDVGGIARAILAHHRAQPRGLTPYFLDFLKPVARL